MKKKKLFRIIKYLIILFFAIPLIGVVFYYYSINTSLSNQEQDIYFSISKGESVKQIGQNLEDNNIIKSRLFFEIYVWRAKQQAKFQAGDYVLSSSFSIKKIAKILTDGEALSRERTIKIIEGWNIKDIEEYLVENNIIKEGEFSSLANYEIGNLEFGISKLEFLSDAPDSANLEGYLFPDTYQIYEDANAQDIIQKMLANFDKKLDSKTRADILRRNKTIYEIIIMASLIEKEVRDFSDMKIVSGIFWNRIKNGQPLESCATLAYIIGINKKQYTLEDTEIDSSYNTYKNQGLPPGPICSPGLNAIQAAIYPEYTAYNYFLSRSDNGETVFGKTYDEHLRNKAKYLK